MGDARVGWNAVGVCQDVVVVVWRVHGLLIIGFVGCAAGNPASHAEHPADSLREREAFDFIGCEELAHSVFSEVRDELLERIAPAAYFRGPWSETAGIDASHLALPGTAAQDVRQHCSCDLDLKQVVPLRDGDLCICSRLRFGRELSGRGEMTFTLANAASNVEFKSTAELAREMAPVDDEMEALALAISTMVPNQIPLVAFAGAGPSIAASEYASRFELHARADIGSWNSVVVAADAYVVRIAGAWIWGCDQSAIRMTALVRRDTGIVCWNNPGYGTIVARAKDVGCID